MKDKKEYKHKTVEELKLALFDAKNELAKLKIDAQMKKTKDVHTVVKKKKEIARILTNLNNLKKKGKNVTNS